MGGGGGWDHIYRKVGAAVAINTKTKTKKFQFDAAPTLLLDKGNGKSAIRKKNKDGSIPHTTDQGKCQKD